MATDHTDQLRFQGFRSPNYTPVPDELFDELMADLSGAELKVLLYIMRRTFGFKKESDNISLSQICNGLTRKDGSVLDRGTGLSKASAARVLNSLEKKNIIVRLRRSSNERGHEATTYGPNMVQAPLSQNKTSPPSLKTRQALVSKSDTQYTVKQETEISTSNIRKELIEKIGNDGGTTEQSQPQDSDASVLESDVSLHSESTSRGMETMEAIGAVLSRRTQRSVSYDEDRQRILAYLQDFSRELSDKAPLKSSVTRAYNLYRSSGRSIDAFTEAMYQARAITKERSGSVRSRSGETSWANSPKNKTAYFFAVLEDVLGLKEQPDNPSPPQ